MSGLRRLSRDTPRAASQGLWNGTVARGVFGKCASAAGGVRLQARSRLPMLSIRSGLVALLPAGTVGANPVAAFGVVIIVGDPTSSVAAALDEYVTTVAGVQWMARPSERLAVSYEYWSAKVDVDCRPTVAETPLSWLDATPPKVAVFTSATLPTRQQRGS